MKTILAMTLFLASSLAWATPNPADYNINVHVVSSRFQRQYDGGTPVFGQILNVVIDGKKYELWANPMMVSAITPGLIVPGDYKAKLTKNKNKGKYAYAMEYELLFPDQTTKKFQVIGESE